MGHARWTQTVRFPILTTALGDDRPVGLRCRRLHRGAQQSQAAHARGRRGTETGQRRLVTLFYRLLRRMPCV